MADALMTERSQQLGELYVREKSRFLSFVRRRILGLSSLDAEDILSEVISSLLRRADLVGEIENLTAYVYRSLANRVTDHQRQSVPQVPAIEAPDPSHPDLPVLPPDSRPRPDRSAENAELRERLYQAVDSLSPDERAVWIATEIEGLSFRELSEEWDEPIGTLLSRKSRATARLRQQLSQFKDYR
jgi:RNA polymerase sigma factor (sigma-70 family)